MKYVSLTPVPRGPMPTAIAKAVWRAFGRADPFFMAHKWHFKVIPAGDSFTLEVVLP